MLKYWFRTAVDPRPSWKAVVAALRSPIVNEKYVAEQLAAKYCEPVLCMGDTFNSHTKVEKSEGIAITCNSWGYHYGSRSPSGGKTIHAKTGVQ